MIDLMGSSKIAMLIDKPVDFRSAYRKMFYMVKRNFHVSDLLDSGIWDEQTWTKDMRKEFLRWYVKRLKKEGFSKHVSEYIAWYFCEERGFRYEEKEDREKIEGECEV